MSPMNFISWITETNDHNIQIEIIKSFFVNLEYIYTYV